MNELLRGTARGEPSHRVKALGAQAPLGPDGGILPADPPSADLAVALLPLSEPLELGFRVTVVGPTDQLASLVEADSGGEAGEAREATAHLAHAADVDAEVVRALRPGGDQMADRPLAEAGAGRYRPHALLPLGARIHG